MGGRGCVRVWGSGGGVRVGEFGWGGGVGEDVRGRGMGCSVGLWAVCAGAGAVLLCCAVPVPVPVPGSDGRGKRAVIQSVIQARGDTEAEKLFLILSSRSRPFASELPGQMRKCKCKCKCATSLSALPSSQPLALCLLLLHPCIDPPPDPIRKSENKQIPPPSSILPPSPAAPSFLSPPFTPPPPKPSPTPEWVTLYPENPLSKTILTTLLLLHGDSPCVVLQPFLRILTPSKLPQPLLQPILPPDTTCGKPSATRIRLPTC